jgi:anthranilate synthase/aminodeoxychorismate synthase-like glutamine amidotransferase
MVLIIDNYDSFTWNLIDYIEQAGQETLVIRNDEMAVEEISKLGFDSILIGPGPGRPENAGVCMNLIQAMVKTKPILGICLGHQALGLHFGCGLREAMYPMHGKVSKAKFTHHPLFDGCDDEIEVMRYHSLVLNPFNSDELQELAFTKQGENMAFIHKRLPVAGFQFHPESILTHTGLLLMKNWFNYIR